MNKRQPPARIEAERVFLRKHALSDAETIFKAVNANRARLEKFLPWVGLIQTLEDEIGYVKGALEKWEALESFDFGMYVQESGEYLGNIGVHTISWQHERCELGYWIIGKHEGHGYVSESVSALEKELFAIGFNRVEIRCSSFNQRSAGVPKRLGYLLEGVLRQDEKDETGYSDTMIFGKLRSGSSAT